MKTAIKCVKVCVEVGSEKPLILYGLIVNEDEHLITIQTKNNKYRVSKDKIQYIRDTNMIFERGVYDD